MKYFIQDFLDGDLKTKIWMLWVVLWFTILAVPACLVLLVYGFIAMGPKGFKDIGRLLMSSV